MRLRHTRKAFVGGIAVAVVLALAACGQGQTSASDAEFDAESYFRGKTIRVVTSSSPGGTTDAGARALADRLGDYIPGNPRMVVSNVTPHVAGMNFVWNAPADGMVLGFMSNTVMEFELYEGAEWDGTKFRYVGSIDSQCADLVFMRGNLGYENLDDVRGSDSPPLTMMAQVPDPASVEPMTLGMMLAAEWLDLPLEIKRVAESGTGAILLAFERDQINTARMGDASCALPKTRPGWISDGYLIPALDVSAAGPGGQLPAEAEEAGLEPPHISELLTEEQVDQWTGIVAARRAGGKPIVLPPGTPDNVVNVLREAFAKASQDPEFRDAMKQVEGGQTELEWRPGDEYTQLVQENHQALVRWKDDIEKIAQEMYDKYLQ